MKYISRKLLIHSVMSSILFQRLIRIFLFLMVMYVLIFNLMSPSNINFSDNQITIPDVSINVNSRISLTQYIDHEPIFVENDTALADVASSGSGTSTHPYIIENLRISNFTDGGILKSLLRVFIFFLV